LKKLLPVTYACFLALLICLHAAHGHGLAPNVNAVWVFASGWLADATSTAGPTLIANAAASGLNTIYLSVYQSIPNSSNRLMYPDANMAAFITQAHTKNINVFVAYSANDWASIGCSPSAFPQQRVAEVLAYNTANQSARFDGVILDIEPPAGDASLVGLYQCLQQQMSPSLRFAAALNANFKDEVTFNNVTKPFYAQVVDLNADHIVLMGYRNFVGTADCTQGDGIVCLDDPAIAYANSQGRSYQIVVGLETGDPSKINVTDTKTSFFTLGQSGMNNQIAGLYNFYETHSVNSQFIGIAVNAYQQSYLSGTLAGWPATNLEFPAAPTIASVPIGSNAVAYPSNIGASSFMLTFSNVTTAGTVTVLPIDPSTAGTIPSGYQLTNGLAFDISTTAVFSGPVNICFTVPSVDPAVFATLSVLHRVSGNLVDQTTSRNPVSQTICAAVTSFSPFVLAHMQPAIPVDPFAAFSVVIPYATSQSLFEQGSFMLGAGKQINPVSDAVSFGFNTASIQIAPGSFRQWGLPDLFLLDGTVNGVQVYAVIQGRGKSTMQYDFALFATGLDLTHETEPMKVGLRIGNEGDSAIIHANVHP
jgi:hypothetical protein